MEHVQRPTGLELLFGPLERARTARNKVPPGTEPGGKVTSASSGSARGTWEDDAAVSVTGLLPASLGLSESDSLTSVVSVGSLWAFGTWVGAVAPALVEASD